jgi:predicted nucleic acid-binding protein
MTGKELNYIDSAIYIAWVRSEDRGEGDVIHAITNKQIIPVGSVIVRTEVLTLKLSAEKREILERVLSPPQLQLKSVTIRIADLAREIREYYANEIAGGRKELPAITTPDAIHLATAIYFKCQRFITLDGVKKSKNPSKLLLLNGSVAGKYPLRICEPAAAQKAWSI